MKRLSLLPWLWVGLMGLLGSMPHARANETVTLVMTDAQGTPVVETDIHGTVLARYAYRPYGTSVGGPLPAGPGYTGHVNDPGTGLVYMQRYYDPATGRFLSPDPVGPVPGDVFNLGRYLYANNNPVRFTDPNGRNATAALGGLIIESWNFLHGDGFNGAQVWGAVKDGYNGQGAGIGAAALQDAMTFVPIPAGKLAQGAKLLGKAGKVIASKLAPRAAKESEQIIEGIYEFVGQSGKKYVGQSSNIPRRIAEHVRSGKLPPGNQVSTTAVSGGKTAREVAEQLRINELGGVRNLENKVNPIGPNRQHLLDGGN